jgi:signal transduction protein with GAF and PtsI domain
MSANFTDSTQTWPKSRITKDLANDAKSRIKLSNALDKAKAFVEETDDQVNSNACPLIMLLKDTDDRTREVRDLVQHLYEALEQNNNGATSYPNRVCF